MGMHVQSCTPWQPRKDAADVGWLGVEVRLVDGEGGCGGGWLVVV